MKPFHKLFAAIDKTRTSQNAVDYAVRLALHENATLTFCHAVDLERDESGRAGIDAPENIARLTNLRREARALLDGALSAADGRAVPARILELAGSTAVATAHAAERRGASAIVVGSEASKRGSKFIGTLAEDVLRLTDVPVILVSGPSAAVAPPSSIVVAIDNSLAARSALDFALDLAEGGRAHVVAVHVKTKNETDSSIRKGVPLLEDIVAYAARRDVKIDAALARGRVVDELANVVKAFRADMLVIGTDGPGMLRALPMPSISRRVAGEVSVPVAIVRAGQFERSHQNRRVEFSIAS